MAGPSEQRRQLGDAQEVIAACERLETQIAELRAAYEQFFLGIERRPPTQRHREVTEAMAKLRGTFVRHTLANFRVQAVQQKLTTWERLWTRTLQEIENGTYARDLRKLARRKGAAAREERPAEASANEPPPRDRDDFSIDEDELAPEEEAALRSGAAFERPPQPVPVAPKPTPPAPTRAPAPVPGIGGVSEDKLRAVYDALVKAKRRCNEDTSKMSYEQVAGSLRKQVPELMQRAGATSVEFKVVIKDGKAILRAIPKT